MSKVHKPSDDTSQLTPAVMIGMTIADTTWRMFVPVFVCALIGYGLDRLIGSRPIGVISGTFVGVALAIMLVRLQYKSAMAKSSTNSHKGNS